MIHLLMLALSWWQPRSLDRISRNNIARREAEAAYQSGHYAQAVERYTFLTQITPTPSPELLLDLGHSCFRLNQYNTAKVSYERLKQVGNAGQISIASVQLGIIACLEKDSAAALNLFQQALLLNPDNEPARYNFELIKRTWSGRPLTAQAGRTPKSTPKTKEQSVPTQSKTVPAPTVAHSDRKDDELRRFRNLNMTQAQARQLLDAMQGDDLPYALARHRKPSNEATSGNRW